MAIECGTERELGEVIDRIQSLPGVIAVAMTAHFAAAREALQAEVNA